MNLQRFDDAVVFKNIFREQNVARITSSVNCIDKTLRRPFYGFIMT